MEKNDQNLNQILNMFEYNDQYIKNDGDNLINVKLPYKYSEVLYDFNIPESHRKYFINDIINYFNDIINNGARITFVNGVNMSCYDSQCYYCDYCHGNIKSDYYYCYDCHNDMCHLCYIETSEEIALANGAKNYHKRQDKLTKCQNFHKIKLRKLNNSAICDLCGNHIFTFNRYHNQNDYDLCLDCSQIDSGKIQIIEQNLQLVDNILSCDQCDFGSLIDWIPLIQDCEGNMILINANKDSQFHYKYAFASIDDHGRTGFYIIWEETSITELITEINLIIEKRKKKHINNGGELSTMWDDCNLPIKKMMVKRNMKVYYG